MTLTGQPSESSPEGFTFHIWFGDQPNDCLKEFRGSDRINSKTGLAWCGAGAGSS